MPRSVKLEDAIVKAHAHERQAVLMRRQSLLMEITKILKEHPEHMNAVLDFLHTLTLQGPALQSPKKAKGPDRASWLDQYTKLENTPSQLLVPLLQAINPIVFSDGNLRTLCAKSQRLPGREILATYIEFATDISKDKMIPKQNRDLDVQLDAAKAACKPERVQALLLPADFDNRDGIYMIHDNREHGGGVLVSRRYHQGDCPVRVPKEFVGPVHLENNFSTVKAHICESKGSASHPCAWLFVTTASPQLDDSKLTPALLNLPLPPMDSGCQEAGDRKRRVCLESTCDIQGQGAGCLGALPCNPEGTSGSMVAGGPPDTVMLHEDAAKRSKIEELRSKLEAEFKPFLPNASLD